MIYVPAFVLWEIAMLLKIGRIVLSEPYGDWIAHLLAQPGYALASVNTEILTGAYAYPFADPFDSVITATASVMDLPLLTRDTDISNSRLADIYW